MSRSQTHHDHVAAAILAAATGVLADRGDSATMAEVAAAAGVGRTTVYRYFPAREDLVSALMDAAMDELDARIAAAGLTTVDVPEGLARLVRAVLSVATRYRVLGRAGTLADPPRTDLARLEEPVLALLDRGVGDGTLRSDVTVPDLASVLEDLLEGAIRRGVHERLGVEGAAALVVSMFLNGTRLPAAG